MSSRAALAIALTTACGAAPPVTPERAEERASCPGERTQWVHLPMMIRASTTEGWRAEDAPVFDEVMSATNSRGDVRTLRVEVERGCDFHDPDGLQRVAERATQHVEALNRSAVRIEHVVFEPRCGICPCTGPRAKCTMTCVGQTIPSGEVRIEFSMEVASCETRTDSP